MYFSSTSGVVNGKSIHEQVLLATELVNVMKIKRRGGNVGLILDISQVYDSMMSWDFILKVMIMFGFSDSWCRWLRTKLESAKISVILNGGPKEFFFPWEGDYVKVIHFYLFCLL